MKINLISVGNKSPAWIQEGFNEFAKRLPADCALNLIEIPAIKRPKNANLAKITLQEGQEILAAIKSDQLVIALDLKGKSWSTEQLANQLSSWRQEGRDVCLLIGGADGLSPECIKRANMIWSLSALTFQHMLVRVIIAEQIYRAWSLLNNHPYHR